MLTRIRIRSLTYLGIHAWSCKTTRISTFEFTAEDATIKLNGHRKHNTTQQQQDKLQLTLVDILPPRAAASALLHCESICIGGSAEMKMKMTTNTTTYRNSTSGDISSSKV